ncbi:alpha-mannosidase [Candidatus Bathyarchaeota archaeon]|nr:alpha-mannosidase [Candidatus Bathyarchaeota archaeon]
MKETIWTCYFLGHSHIDAAWLWSFSETIEVFRGTCEKILALMEKYPQFIYCQSSAQYYRWLEEKYPEIFEKVKKMVKEGRWEVVGGTWVECDGNMPSGESFVRQFLYGKRYFEEKLGVDVKVAWMPDSFGYAWTLPQIMKKSGMEFFLTQKMNWNDTTLFPYYFFKWIAPDGSSIIAHQTVGTYSEPVTEERIAWQIKMLSHRQGLNDLLVLFGIGDHGGGVSEDMIKRALEFIRGKNGLKGKFSTAEEYFRVLVEKTHGKIPEINDELYLQYHRGTYTTQAKVKKNNRKAECLLETAEKFSSIAEKYGYEYPKSSLEESWKKLLLNQFHDVLPGSSIPEVYKDAEKSFNFIFKTVNSIISESLRVIASRIDTSGDGRSILVFNPLSWRRTDIVQIAVDDLEGHVEIYDEDGRLIPSQLLERDKKIIFVAEDVPSIGYREYKAKKGCGKRKKIRTEVSVEEDKEEIKLENEFFTVKVDKQTGLVKSIYDKRCGKEVLKGYGNIIQIYNDYPVGGRSSVVLPMDAEKFDAWEIYIYQQPEGVKYVELRNPEEVKVSEKGPVKVSVSVKYKYVQEKRPDSTFIQEITLYHKIPMVIFKLHVDWHAEHRLAKVSFPLNVHSDYTAYEIPYGFIIRRNPFSPDATLAERAKYEVPGQKWIDHTDDDGSYGVSLLNDCKYGFDVVNDVIRMTLLRSAKYPVEMRAHFGLPVNPAETKLLTDQGIHEISYALYPHISDFREALTVRRAYEFNYPLIPVVEPNHNGDLPKRHSFISIEPNNVILTVMKKAEDSDGLVLRFYEISGKEAEVVIRIDELFREAVETNLIEKPISRIRLSGEKIRIPVSKYEIKTIKLVQ